MKSERYWTRNDWIGRRVRTTRPLKNGYMEIPEGTICEIGDKFGKFRLKTEPCSHCGVAIFINGIDRYDFVLLPLNMDIRRGE